MVVFNFCKEFQYMYDIISISLQRVRASNEKPKRAAQTLAEFVAAACRVRIAREILAEIMKLVGERASQDISRPDGLTVRAGFVRAGFVREAVPPERITVTLPRTT
jgi:hypothetical protein